MINTYIYVDKIISNRKNDESPKKTIIEQKYRGDEPTWHDNNKSRLDKRNTIKVMDANLVYSIWNFQTHTPLKTTKELVLMQVERYPFIHWPKK